MKRMLLVLLMAGGLVRLSAADPLFQTDFEKAEVDKVPEGLLVLDGAFAVKEADGNKFLELPGAPLDTFGVLFGPARGVDVSVSARIFGTGKGRRYPAMAVGLGGNNGYRLQIAPAKKTLELLKGEEVLASAPFTWESGSWTRLKLQVRKVGDAFKVEGRAWKEQTPEPKEWLIAFDEKNKPNEGRASVFGNPFSGTPIRFDDLTVAPVEK
jgi:hypothetical protein